MHLRWLISLVFIVFFGEINASKRENELYNFLLTNYSSLVRPVYNASEPVKVYMRLHLQQIVDVEEKRQVIMLNAWLNYKWFDYRLIWNPRDYENITSVRFSSEENLIWVPDILLYNSVDERFDSTYKSNLVVYNTGEVNWVPPGVFHISCRLIVTWFPFDEQSCVLVFSSWTYHHQALDIELDLDEGEEPGMDLSGYIPNGEWELMNAPAWRREELFDCCEEPYTVIRFALNIRRRTLYYAFNVIIPSLLLSCMTLLAFCLPAHDMSEKIGFQTTILLSVCFFLTVVSELTPPTSEAVPLLGVFFSTLTIIVAISTAFTICVLNVRYRQPVNHRMSKLFQQVFLVWLPYLLLMRRPEYKMVNRKAIKLKDLEALKEEEEACTQHYPRTSLITENGDSVQHVAGNGSLPTETQQNGHVRNNLFAKIQRVPTEQLFLERKVGDGIFPMRRSNTAKQRRIQLYERYVSKYNPEYDASIIAVISYYRRIHARLKYVRDRVKRFEWLDDVEEDYKFASMALDRLCLVLFTVFISITIGAIFLSPPYLIA